MDEMMLRLTFILWLMSPVSATGCIQDILGCILPQNTPAPIPLSIMDKSIDDKFCGCPDEMAKKVKEKYLGEEMNDPDFKKAWDSLEACAKTRLTKSEIRREGLTIDHHRAICVYTYGKNNNNQNDGVPVMYGTFNGALREGAAKYGTSGFKYHTLYFWLTSAIQILKGKECQTTYRKSDRDFTGNKNDIIRFGMFASSSLTPDLTGFGEKSCFHIKTCLGADLKDYSYFNRLEKEVLIPPYEQFKITEIAQRSYKSLNCEKIFVLEALKEWKSDLNCKEFQPGTSGCTVS